MSNEKTYVEFYELGKEARCKVAMNSPLKGIQENREFTPMQLASGIESRMAGELMFSLYRIYHSDKSEEEMKVSAEETIRESFKELETGFDECNFDLSQERDDNLERAKNELIRFCIQEAKRDHRFGIVPCDPKEVDLGSELFSKQFAPSYIDVEPAPDALPGMPEPECTLHAVKISSGRPDISQSSAYKNKKLYAMIRYLESFVAPGHTIMLKASIYWLRKNNDSYGVEENFDEDFFVTTNGNNIVTMQELYTNDGNPSELESFLSEAIKEFKNGTDRCSPKDCEKCRNNNKCNFKQPPVTPKEEDDPEVMKNTKIKYTPEQRAAISEDTENVVVVSPAGSGKTTTLTGDAVNYIAATGEPKSLLVLSFTNSAVRELKERIPVYAKAYGVDIDPEDLMVFTIDSFCMLCVRMRHKELGFPEEPSVMENFEKIPKILRLLEGRKIPHVNFLNATMNEKNYKGVVPLFGELFTIIKRGKNGTPFGLPDVEEFYNKLLEDGKLAMFPMKNSSKPEHKSEICDILLQAILLFDLYDETMRQESLIEYEDLPALMFEILRDEPGFLDQFGFRRILIDEAQDTNPAQIRLVRTLKEGIHDPQLKVVGDPNQSIYRFTGAEVDNMIHPENHYGALFRRINSTKNFRSDGNLVLHCNSIAKHMAGYDPSTDMIPTKSAGTEPEAKWFFTEDEKLEAMYQEVLRNNEEGLRPTAHIAYKKSTLMSFASYCTERGLTVFYAANELLKDNSRVQAALGLGKAIESDQNEEGLYDYVNALLQGRLLLLMTETPAYVESVVSEVRAEILALKNLPEKDQKTYFLRLLRQINPLEDEAFEYFLEKVERKRTLRHILQLFRDFEEYGDNVTFRRTKIPAEIDVVCITAHSSKGLQYPAVIDDLSDYEEKGLSWESQEERLRLMYVASTRAEKRLLHIGLPVAYGSGKQRVLNHYLQIACEETGQEWNREEILQKVDAYKEANKKPEALLPPTAQALKDREKAEKEAKKLLEKARKDAEKAAAKAEAKALAKAAKKAS